MRRKRRVMNTRCKGGGGGRGGRGGGCKEECEEVKNAEDEKDVDEKRSKSDEKEIKLEIKGRIKLEIKGRRGNPRESRENKRKRGISMKGRKLATRET